MVMYANEGRWDEVEIDREMDASLLGIGISDLPDVRVFSVRCGGCPWGAEISVPSALLEDWPMPAALTTQSWQADPIRCPYCVGTLSRPDNPTAAPYPVAPGG